ALDEAVVTTRVPGLDLVPSGPDLAGAAVDLPGREDRERILARALVPARFRYRRVFLDCPPSLDLLTVNALVAADRVIVPVQCEYYALEGLSRLLETVEAIRARLRSEEHTSELQSPYDLVCRLLLEKKKKNKKINRSSIKKNTSLLGLWWPMHHHQLCLMQGSIQ